MKEITILSGKGGTGKTSITAALASVARNAVFCDNDVDAADLHLIFNPIQKEEHSFSSSWDVEIDTEKCTQCNICKDYCRFEAIHTSKNEELTINHFKCEGCRLCERVCPENAICSKQNKNNYWYVSDTRFGTLVHAKMGPGEENSGKLVTQVRKRARELAEEYQLEYIVNDGPPGIGCAAISSISGTSLVLLVIEPTKSGLHDAKRLIELVESFHIPLMTVLNKSNINTDIANQIEDFLQTKQIKLLAKVPFDKEMVESMVEGKTILEYNPASEISNDIKQIWQSIKMN
jgi:MinD superfamily P-loop ATPase